MSDLTMIRNKAQLLMKTHRFESAIFCIELLIKNNEDCLSDSLMLAEALYYNKQYRKVLDFILKRKFEQKYLTFRLLAAQCCVEIKKFIEALQLLNNNVNSSMDKTSLIISAITFCENKNDFWIFDNQESEIFGRSYKVLESNCYLVLGEIYEYMGSRDSASIFYKLAIKSDITNFYAVQKLYEGNMLTIIEARSFINNLDFSSCEDSTFAKTLLMTYTDMFNLIPEERQNYNEEIVLEHPYLQKLSDANNFYNTSRFRKCYDITKRLLKEDPHNDKCFILHSAVLKEMNLTNELSIFAKSLVDNYPDKKESWYSLGCYYLATKVYTTARRYFLKATEIDKFFGYAWLAVGHTYSIENERDQALAAYLSASHAISESHIPILYIALEYSLSKTMSVSFLYLEKAMAIGSFDPYCWHEKGFILFNNKNYNDALHCFLNAYDMQKKDNYQVLTFWEPLLNNIGHCYYKLGELDKALTFFQKASSRKPKNPSTISSIALVYAHKGEYLNSQSHLVKVLSFNKDDHFANSLLQVVKQQDIEQPCKFLVDFEVFFKRPQSNSRMSNKDSFIEECSFSDSLDSFKRIVNYENVNVDSDDEMELS